MLAFTFASFLGVAEFLGLGEKAEYFYYCSDPAFFVTRDAEGGYSDKTSFVLKGTLNAPQPGYVTHMTLLGISGPQAHVVIEAGQPVDPKGYGRGLPAVSKVQVEEKLGFLTPAVGLLRVRVQGLTRAPWEFTCDITETKASSEQ